MRCRGPIHPLVMLRARGVAGAFFQRVGARTCVTTAGNYLGSVGSNGLRVIPGVLNVTAAEGDSVPLQFVFDVTATDSDGNVRPFTVVESPDAPWLTLTQTATTFTVTIDPSGLTQGVYATDLIVSSFDAAAEPISGSPKTIPVTLTILPAGAFILTETVPGFVLDENGEPIELE